jgi:Mg-chelatase subunit ChlD
MTNFRINFENPWLLLLLIPAIALPLISYFRLGKRYRFTRNRITSIALHITVMILSISVLAGLTFSYFLPNKDNEVILLVDASYSNSENEDERNDVDDFIKAVINSANSKFKLGVVTFGYDQVYAAELTNETSTLYAQYLQAPKPNVDTATDIAAALTYASELFTKPETARIVLLSDALETDGAAKNVIKSIALKGIKIDTVYFTPGDIGREVQVMDAVCSENRVLVGQEFTMELSIQSSYEGMAKITPTDSGLAGTPIEIELKAGINKVVIPCKFTLPGMHELSFAIEADDDQISLNNVYQTYFYIEVFDDILIIEGVDEESKALTEMLREELNVTVIKAYETDKLPKTLKELREFDEVILMNVSNGDLPSTFVNILYSYVHDVGGGLFTVAGHKEGMNPTEKDAVNAYTRDDMYDTLYQQMLPVEIIEYTPPVAVMILVDVSKSMYTPGAQSYEGSNLQAALQGARGLLNEKILSERDYVGIMTLAQDYSEEIEITPRTQTPKIKAAIDAIEDSIIKGNFDQGNQTIFSTALERAGKALSAISDVEKRHIIIVTDGQPTDKVEDYSPWIKENAAMGITMSIVGIKCTSETQSRMEDILVEYAGEAGVTKENFHNVDDVAGVPEAMREDLMLPDIKEVNYETFYPTVKDSSSLVMSGLYENQLPALNGFYGVKIKDNAKVILSSTYTPIYAEWDLGEGRVGTFACDLRGTWSSEMVSPTSYSYDAGKTLINNIITSLFPKKNIKVPDIDTEITGDNYSTVLSVFTELNDGEYLDVTITSPPSEDGGALIIQKITVGENEGYSRIPFSVTTSGVHNILVEKKDKDGNVISMTETYKALSYSKEYNAFIDKEAAEELVKTLSENSDGEIIDRHSPEQVFVNAVKYLHIVINPKILFMILAVVLFLLDIAVRKFKWKWPHEIIRERRITQAMKKK